MCAGRPRCFWRRRRRRQPALGGVVHNEWHAATGVPVFSAEVGYVQQVDMQALQQFAEEIGGRVVVDALPGVFAMPGRPLARVLPGGAGAALVDSGRVVAAFTVGRDRVFDHDPRLGLIVLSEIAGRALSPAVNDPGTAIGIVGTLVRLLALWTEHSENLAAQPVECDRVEAPLLQVDDLFDDAFTAIARDGAGAVEVGIRLQKALQSLAAVGDGAMRLAAIRHSRHALSRSENALTLPHDVEVIRSLARGVGQPSAAG